MDIQWTQLPFISKRHVYGPSTQHISEMVYDSRDVQNQSAFFCIIGEETDGHLYIEEAIQNGANTIVGSNKEIIESYVHVYPQVTFLLVLDSREALALCAVEFTNHACDKLIKIGITGTNGKTTVATYVRDLFNLVGLPCGMLGTNGIYSSSEKLTIKKSTPTTPMASDIQAVFSELVRRGDKAVSLEVSSIALDQHRVSGFDFDVAIHTNISEEHMEYHKTLDHYKECKLRLFKQAKASIVNLDDPGMGLDILQVVNGPLLTYSKHIESGADLIWTNIKHRADGMSFDLLYDGRTTRISVPLYGEYNIGNLVSAIGAALLSDVKIEEILHALPKMQQVEGRFQVIHGPERRKIVLDYAHTPVALDAIMQAVRKLPHERLITLITGIGIRDFTKMPKMAKTAEGKAEILVVTVDHPDHHNPWQLIDTVLSGFSVPYMQEVLTAPSRKEGVIKALEASRPGDIVLLTSGCINGCQFVQGQFVPHSDEEIIQDFFSRSKLSV